MKQNKIKTNCKVLCKGEQQIAVQLTSGKKIEKLITKINNKNNKKNKKTQHRKWYSY